MAAAVAEVATARPALTYEDAERMFNTKCSLEAFQERMLSSEFNVARDGERLYGAACRLASTPIRAWLRSSDFAVRVGAIEWEDPLKVFFDACKEGDEEYVSRLSEEHPEWLDKGCKHSGLTVLHAVCYGGLMRFVPEVVSRFGDVDVPNQFGWTPLFYACWSGQIGVIEYLVSAGADVKAVSFFRETMLHAAGGGGNPAIVKALLDMGLDVNARDNDHRTPLHMACESAELDVVRFLHERGAVLDPPGLFSPLCEALSCGHVGVAEYLISVGASVERAREQWERILDGVIDHDSVPGMDWLLSRGGVSVSKELIDHCLREGKGGRAVLQHVLLHEESAPLVSGVDESLLPDGFLGGCASLSKWREHELRVELRYLMLSWRRGFVACGRVCVS
jgi:ankyrin repeat protein